MVRASLIIMLGFLASCGQQPGEHVASSSESSVTPDTSPPADSIESDTVAADNSVAKGAQGAAEVLSKYYDLLKAGRLDDASKLWTLGDTGALQASEQSLASYDSREVDIGEPGRVEGAAGSLYISIPVQIHARRKSGEEVQISGEATLRRSNDVPGATPEQLSWRIMQLDLQTAEQE